MNFKGISKSDIPRLQHKDAKYRIFFEQFLNSGFEAAVIEENVENLKSFQCCLINSLRRNGIDNIKVIVRDGKVYVVRIC